jgi:hypothetical protein
LQTRSDPDPEVCGSSLNGGVSVEMIELLATRLPRLLNPQSQIRNPQFR